MESRPRKRNPRLQKIITRNWDRKPANCGLGNTDSKLSSKVENQEISSGKRAPATQEGGPCGQAYGDKWGCGRRESGRTGAGES
jgi:hypothetical protein